MDRWSGASRVSRVPVAVPAPAVLSPPPNVPALQARPPDGSSARAWARRRLGRRLRRRLAVGAGVGLAVGLGVGFGGRLGRGLGGRAWRGTPAGSRPMPGCRLAAVSPSGRTWSSGSEPVVREHRGRRACGSPSGPGSGSSRACRSCRSARAGWVTTARYVCSRPTWVARSARSGRKPRGTFVVTVLPSDLMSPIGSLRKPPCTIRSRMPDDDLLLAGGPSEVALARGLADAGERERLLAVQVVPARR